MSAQPPPPEVIAALRPHLIDFLTRVANAVRGEDVRVNSWWRSLAHNEEVGGASGPTLWSQHLVGLAFDLDGDPARFATWERRLRAQGLGVVRKPGYVHVQYLPRGTLQRRHLIALQLA